MEAEIQGERDGENNHGAHRLWSMVLTIIETVSVLAVVIGVIIAVFGAPSSGTLVRAGIGDHLYRRSLWGAVCDLAYRHGTGASCWPSRCPQGDHRDVAECVRAAQTRP